MNDWVIEVRYRLGLSRRKTGFLLLFGMLAPVVLTAMASASKHPVGCEVDEKVLEGISKNPKQPWKWPDRSRLADGSIADY